MRLSSIRARVVYLAAIFAFLLVGSVTLATYFFVADGMARSAEDTAWRFAQHASRMIARSTTSAKLAAADAGLEGDEREREALRRVLREVPDMFTTTVTDDGAYALYIANERDDLELAWYSGEAALNELAHARTLALERRQPVQSTPRARDFLTGMFSAADLGAQVVHVPLQLPDETAGVLDVVYRPVREEGILDSARIPMFVVAGFAIVAAVLMMQVITSWILSLLDTMRRTADSIEAGRLDVRLPVEGEHEIADLARSLNALIDRLARRADVQTRFVADASHELATPVAGIRGYVNILRDWGAEDPEMRTEALAAIDRESRRMARLCGDLLSVIRSEEAAEMRPVRYDVDSVAREVLASAATRYMDKKLEFIGPDEGPLWITGDRDRIEELLSILVDNACKYTPAGGRVSVSTHRRRDAVVIKVSDTGVGIPASDLQNVFERFYRSDASRSKQTGGFGLGLAIAKHIVDMSGGTISVSSIENEGTTFTITLPRHRKPD
ncbi:MAG: ATP-binding protein [Anaerosomatales bacterium]|nr:ATP-binding protein [Anaerosomatales bacterium]